MMTQVQIAAAQGATALIVLMGVCEQALGEAATEIYMTR